MTGRWHAPLDPASPDVEQFMEALADEPMTAYSGRGDDIAEAFERRHRATCDRCQEYGAANIEVTGP